MKLGRVGGETNRLDCAVGALNVLMKGSALGTVKVLRLVPTFGVLNTGENWRSSELLGWVSDMI